LFIKTDGKLIFVSSIHQNATSLRTATPQQKVCLDTPSPLSKFPGISAAHASHVNKSNPSFATRGDSRTRFHISLQKHAFPYTHIIIHLKIRAPEEAALPPPRPDAPCVRVIYVHSAASD